MTGKEALEAACRCDREGREAEAVPFYEAALAGALSEEDRQGAYLGYGSSLRALGRHEDAVAVFERAMAEFPENRALQCFAALAFYNVGRARDAVSLLLRNLAETTSDPAIASYRRALLFYADRPDEVWS